MGGNCLGAGWSTSALQSPGSPGSWNSWLARCRSPLRARFASWTFERVTDIRGLFEDAAACERAAEKDHDPAGIPTSCPMITAAVAARPELMQALERAAIRLAVLERSTASDARRQALEDDMDARPGVYRRLAQ